MAFLLIPPPTPNGDEAAQLRQMHTWLYQMHDQLNYTLNQLQETVQVTKNEADATRVMVDGGGELSTQAESLKSLIIKTAHTLKVSMDQIRRELKSDYLAVSDFGQYQQEVTNQITASAQGVLQEFQHGETVTSLKQGQAGFSAYVTETNQYIKTGYLFNEQQGGVSVPVYGVAVGDRITVVQADGTTLLKREGDMATFTARELAFWTGETKVAYINQGKLTITNAQILQTLAVGEFIFSILPNGMLAITN